MEASASLDSNKVQPSQVVMIKVAVIQVQPSQVADSQSGRIRQSRLAKAPTQHHSAQVSNVI